MLVKDLKLKQNTLLIYLFCIIAGFVLGSLMLFIMTCLQSVGILKDTSYTVALVGSLMAVSVFYLVFALMGLVDMNNQFNLMVGFGMTRKNFFFHELITSYIHMGIGVLVIGIFYGIENALLKIPFYAQYTYEELAPVNVIYMLLGLALVFPILRLFMGSIVARTGKKGFWVLWGIWMFFSLSPNIIKNRLHGDASVRVTNVMIAIVQWGKEVPVFAWVITCVIIAIVMLFVSWKMLIGKSVD